VCSAVSFAGLSFAMQRASAAATAGQQRGSCLRSYCARGSVDGGRRASAPNQRGSVQDQRGSVDRRGSAGFNRPRFESSAGFNRPRFESTEAAAIASSPTKPRKVTRQIGSIAAARVSECRMSDSLSAKQMAAMLKGGAQSLFGLDTAADNSVPWYILLPRACTRERRTALRRSPFVDAAALSAGSPPA
jgi:hypothetical protein